MAEVPSDGPSQGGRGIGTQRQRFFFLGSALRGLAMRRLENLFGRGSAWFRFLAAWRISFSGSHEALPAFAVVVHRGLPPLGAVGAPDTAEQPFLGDEEVGNDVGFRR